MKRLTPEEQLTLDSYQAAADYWTSRHDTPRFWGDNFDAFFEMLPKGRVLEIGCGAGRDAKELIEHGYDYIGTDISSELIKKAREANPNGQFEEASVYDLDYKEYFDGFWCAAVLLHIPKERIGQALSSIRRNILPGGIGFITVKEGSGEQVERREEIDNREFYFVFWQSDEFKKVLAASGLEVTKEGYMPMSERKKWLTYHVKVMDKD